ncbi:hypothetical protein [Streptomyces sp. NPDC051577]
MGSKYTKRYSDEYKRDAIELVRPTLSSTRWTRQPRWAAWNPAA